MFLLRAVQMGLTLDDLDSMEYGLVVDMMTESGNDSQTYRTLAEQEDFDKF